MSLRICSAPRASRFLSAGWEVKPTRDLRAISVPNLQGPQLFPEDSTPPTKTGRSRSPGPEPWRVVEHSLMGYLSNSSGAALASCLWLPVECTGNGGMAPGISHSLKACAPSPSRIQLQSWSPAGPSIPPSGQPCPGMGCGLGPRNPGTEAQSYNSFRVN